MTYAGVVEGSGQAVAGPDQRRRHPDLLLGVLALAVIATVCLGVWHSPSSSGTADGVAGTALFGGNAPLVKEEESLGRRLAVVRSYYVLGETFPTSSDATAMARGRTLLVSLDTNKRAQHSQAPRLLRAVAAGTDDAAVTTFLTAVEHAAVADHLLSIYISFEHEADTSIHGRDPKDFVAAWDHVHGIAVSRRLDWQQGGRLHWVWILTASAFRKGIAGQYWPAANEVDVVGSDGYNPGGCRGARGSSNGGYPPTSSPSAIFGDTVTFADGHRTPMFIPEWGSGAGPSSGYRAQYIDSMRTFLEHTPQIRAALYWDSASRNAGCTYSIDGDPASVRAMAELGSSPALQGHLAA